MCLYLLDAPLLPCPCSGSDILGTKLACRLSFERMLRSHNIFHEASSHTLPRAEHADFGGFDL